MINDILNYWYKIEYFTPCWCKFSERIGKTVKSR